MLVKMETPRDSESAPRVENRVAQRRPAPSSTHTDAHSISRGQDPNASGFSWLYLARSHKGLVNSSHQLYINGSYDASSDASNLSFPHYIPCLLPQIPPKFLRHRRRGSSCAAVNQNVRSNSRRMHQCPPSWRTGRSWCECRLLRSTLCMSPTVRTAP